MRSRYIRLAAPAVLALTIGACGGSAQSDGRAAPTVSVKNVDGFGAVLVDDHGHALYASDQEADGKVRCKDGCTTFWDPLEPGASAPTASSAVSGRLSVIRRADDGKQQVTYRGKPLYRFNEDPGPGQVTGDNVTDDFGGIHFTWHAVTSKGSPDASTRPSQSSGGY